MKDMALRKSPVRTLACLTANRANGQKWARPITAAGKARVALNALQHGCRTDPAGAGKSSSRAGEREGEALYRWLRGEITATFGMGRPCPIPDATRAGRSNGELGVVPGARLCALTSKAGMSFSFMGVLLAAT
jgi:hypothetical protein